MPRSDQLLYQIALTQIDGIGDKTARHLLQIVGDPESIFKSSRKFLLAIQGLGEKSVSEILKPEVMRKAEKEVEFCLKNNIQCYFIKGKHYPKRLIECEDAPILLYFKGECEFNKQKSIAIVGTRHSSAYGNIFCNNFLQEISGLYPDTLIMSGLAYGIDINAHRYAIQHNLPTIGVLAHGLDRIYPAEHRQSAVEMLNNGGLITEFASGIKPDKFNFVRRNRIIAGMADVTIVVESNMKGGSLITADIANSYCRDVFAVPGRTNDKRSEGCNKLIAEHKADLLLSTEYFLQQMGWDIESEKLKKQPKQKELFLDLNPDEQKIVDTLTKHQSLHVDLLTSEAQIPSYQLFSILLELEMKGVIKNLPGNLYALV